MITINVPVHRVYGKERTQIINAYKKNKVPDDYVSIVKLSHDVSYGHLAKYITLYAKYHPEFPCICLNIDSSKKYYVHRSTAFRFLERLESNINTCDSAKEIRFICRTNYLGWF